MKAFKVGGIGVATVACMLTLSVTAQARDWYVSANTGKGKEGTKESPAKDLGNIVDLLKAGDIVYVAGGTYFGKGERGSDEIKVPVKLYGGYDDTFTTRDPWGATRSVMTGKNPSQNYAQTTRLWIDLAKFQGGKSAGHEVVVDGFVVDNGGRNYYSDAKNLTIVRKAKPGKNPTPSSGGIGVTVGKLDKFAVAPCKVTVSNNIVMNVAATKGALFVQAFQNGTVDIVNNLVINNTGSGISAMTAYHGAKDFPKFNIKNNTVLFSWKFDAIASSFSGISLETEDGTLVSATNNVFAFADRIGVQHGGKDLMLFKDNLIAGNLGADFWETKGDGRISLTNLADEASFMEKGSSGNISKDITVSVSQEWAKNYASRVNIDRNAMEADIKAPNTRLNALRRMLGLPLQAGTIKGNESPVWLNRMTVDDAVAAGKAPYETSYGSSIPKADGSQAKAEAASQPVTEAASE